MDWLQIASLAASVATVVAAVAVLVTALIYFGQLRAMTKGRQLESLLVIMRYADDLELRRARYFMFEHREQLAPLFAAPCSRDSRKAIDERIRVLSSGELTIYNIDLSLNALNNICFLIRYDYAPPDAVNAFMKNSLLHAWQNFELYIRHRRTRKDDIAEPSRYAERLEWVVMTNCKPAPPASTRQPATV